MGGHERKGRRRRKEKMGGGIGGGGRESGTGRARGEREEAKAGSVEAE